MNGIVSRLSLRFLFPTSRPRFPALRLAPRLLPALAMSLAPLPAADTALSGLVKKFTEKRAAGATPQLAAQPSAQPVAPAIDRPVATAVKLDPAGKKAAARKPSPPLASLPAPRAASGPRRILVVDDDWDNNSPDATGRLTASDEIFRSLVAAAVGGDAAAWSVVIAERYKDGPGFERLRDYNVVLWYTGASHGADPSGVSTLSREDEKTARRYLEEAGGSFILVSPGYANNLSYATSWTDSPHPFLREVVGVNGLAGFVQRGAGTLLAHDGSSYNVQEKGAAEALFSAVNPDGAAFVFTSKFDPKKTAEGAVPVAVAHPFGGGRFVYVGFSFENIPEVDRARAFKILLEAAGAPDPQAAPAPAAGTGLGRVAQSTRPIIPEKPLQTIKEPTPAVALVTDPPKPFGVTGSGHDSFNFSASGTGTLRLQVQSRGVPITVTVLHPDGRNVERSGTGGFAFDDLATAADLAKGHLWGVSVRAATPTSDTTVVASGSVVVSHPAADPAKVQAQLETLTTRTQVLKAATPVRTVALNSATLALLKTNLSGTTLTPAPAPTITAPPTINRGAKVVPPTPPPPPPPPPPGPVPLLRLDKSAGIQGTKLQARGKDMFPPNTPAGRVLENMNTGAFPAALHFVFGNQHFTAPMTATEVNRYPNSGGEREHETQTGPDNNTRHPDTSYPVRWYYERFYTGVVPKIPVLVDTVMSVYFVTSDGRPSNRLTFTVQPELSDEYLYLPIANGQLIDSALDSIYPNANLSKGQISRDTYLLGFTGHDTFYHTLELKNAWKVVSAQVMFGYKLLGSAEVAEFRPGTNSPYVKVRWYLEPTLLMSNHLNYGIKIHIRGPTGYPSL